MKVFWRQKIAELKLPIAVVFLLAHATKAKAKPAEKKIYLRRIDSDKNSVG